MESLPRGSASTVLLIIGGPLLLAVVELFHPHVHDLLDVDAGRWLAIHYAQIVLFPLAALAMAALIRGLSGIAAAACRVALFVFAVSYVAFDTAAGVATGILIEAARSSAAPEMWRPAIDALWAHPIVGGSPMMAPPPFLAVLGAIALSVGGVTGAIALRGVGNAWPPILLLAISSFGISVFRTHAWPGGPLTFGGISIAAAWMVWAQKAMTGAKS